MLKAIRAEAFLVLGSLAFAFNGIISKLVLTDGLSAWRLTQVRSTGAFLVLLVYVAIRNGKSLLTTRVELPWLAAYGVIGFALVQVGYFIAIGRMPISIALIIEFTAPIWIVIYIRFVKKKYVPQMMWLSLLMGFSGLLLVGQVWKGLTLDGIGVLAAFLDAFALAAYFLLGEKLVAIRSINTLTVWGLGFASLVWAIVTPVWSFPFKIFTEDINLLGIFKDQTLPGWVLISWIILMGTIVPYLLILTGLKQLSASTSSVIGMLEPVIAGVIAWWWLNETFTVLQLIGGAVVIMGIIVADRARRETR
ncbi:MAG: DMT family transporter [Actinobacteria bacterium]|nr:DMT family transporter [Actinomycetota bacterium]